MAHSDTENFIACPKCGYAEIQAGSRFCEMCGTSMPMPLLAAAETCVVCSGTVFDSSGFCNDCGTRRVNARIQEMSCVRGIGFAALTDTGLKHTRNDDAFAVSGPGEGGAGVFFTICDGVSNSQSPDIGSAAAAGASNAWLETALAAAVNPRTAIREAIRKAHDAVCLVPFDRSAELDPPAATIVAVVVRAGSAPGKLEIIVGWLGDSRLYWLSLGGSGQQFTHDHSWANQAIDSGRMTETEARNDRNAHAITRCLGTSDFTKPSPCPEPSVETYEVAAEGWLLACTDGLWNYAETPAALILAGNGKLSNGTAEEICRQYVSFALARGGMDNITCVMVRLG